MGNKSTILLAPVLAGNRVSRINNGLKKELVSLNKEVHSLPKGKLYIRYRNNHVQFNKREDGKDKGITSFPETVYQLARRQYLQLHMQLLEQIIEEGWTAETDRIISAIYPQIESLLKKYEDAGLDVEQITMTPNQRIWNSDRNSQKENRRDELIYPTRGNVYMTFNHDIREEARVKEVLFQMLTCNPPWNKILISVVRRAGCQIEQPA